MDNNNVPTFTPPPPTFTPPSQSRRNGATCHCHPNEPAVDTCARCGKYICQDCAETYTVNSDEYQGKHLCYDCCREIVASNVKTLKKQKAKIIAQYVFTVIGMLFGVLIGSGMVSSDPSVPGWIVLIAAFVGGCLWTFVKNLASIAWNCIKAMFEDFSIGTLIGCLFGIIIGLFKAVVISTWGTIQKLFYYTKYLIQTSSFIKSDTEALQQMADYMEYTLVRSQNVGVDLATLMTEDSQLYNNSYAQSVMNNGEEVAAASVRAAAVSFNEHGEIIRNFAG